MPHKSGPALRHVDSHSSIHEAALEEAKELTELLERSVRQGEMEKALELGYIIVEHWEARTLQHALSEEEGLYMDALELKPELAPVIISLTRDHNLMRKLVLEIKDLLDQGVVSEKLVQSFYALIVIDELHNEDEMEMLEKEVEGLRHAQ
ncbi:hypothetical protein [Paenibacillus sp. DYY-L-2]|uniref:hypothetical protein n=1 Tax=Paenibacillus sp. DYY-L-2 TaxID=3447013 RepID=UPI003F50716B